MFAVSDMDRDGKFELLVHNGGAYSGNYELREFDGKSVDMQHVIKVLYSWGD